MLPKAQNAKFVFFINVVIKFYLSLYQENLVENVAFFLKYTEANYIIFNIDFLVCSFNINIVGMPHGFELYFVSQTKQILV